MSAKAYSPVNMFSGTSAPASPVVGDMYFNTTNGTLYVYNGTTWVGLAASTPSRENKNFLNNGAMRIAQRGAVTPVVGGTTYVTDRFYVYTTGASLTSHGRTTTTLNGVSPTALALQGKTGITGCNVGQRIEAMNVPRGTVTLSAYIYNSTGASITPTYNFYTPNAGDDWSGGNTNRASGNLQDCVNNTWTRVSATVDTAAWTNITYGLGVAFSFGSVLNANTKNIYISGVQLEFGSAATPFEIIPIGEDLNDCMRYYERGNYKGYANILSTGNNVYRIIPYSVVKRTNPTVSTVSISSIDNLSGSGTWSSGRMTPHCAEFVTAISGGSFPYNGIDLVWQADAEL